MVAAGAMVGMVITALSIESVMEIPYIALAGNIMYTLTILPR